MTSTWIVLTILTYTDSLIHSRLIITDMQLTNRTINNTL